MYDKKSSELSMYNRFWIYSDTEAELLKKVTNKTSYKKVSLGTVINESGISKSFTSIINKLDKIKYADSVVVMEGDIRKVKYTDIGV